MNPIRKRRLLLVLVLVVAAGIATALVAMALQRNVAYLYTPSEVLKGEAGDRTRASASAAWCRPGSFERAPGSMEAHFAVDDGDAQLPVVYTGILPGPVPREAGGDRHRTHAGRHLRRRRSAGQARRDLHAEGSRRQDGRGAPETWRARGRRRARVRRNKR